MTEHKKRPDRGQAKGAFPPDLFSGVFYVARNPVTNRHALAFKEQAQKGQYKLNEQSHSRNATFTSPLYDCA
jgi:hypothetical protein